MPYRLSRRAATLEPIGCLKGGHITVLDMEMQGTGVEASPTHSHVFLIGGRPLDQSGHSAHAGTESHPRNCSFADCIIESPWDNVRGNNRAIICRICSCKPAQRLIIVR